MLRGLLKIGVLSLAVIPMFGQTPQKLAAINKKVVGKWMSADQKSYIEFSADGSCATGDVGPDSKWQVDQNTLGAWAEGDSFSCGSGALTLIGPDTLTRDYGMGGEPEKFYRGAVNLPTSSGALTVAIAQETLIRQINLPTAHNTLFTCHACYDPSDKGDNDRAPLVSTSSQALTAYLIRNGYVRTVGGKQVFTAKAKQSRYYTASDGMAGLRFATFTNPRILAAAISDPKRVPIEYELLPTAITAGFFGKAREVRTFASFSYENEAWRVCVACR